MFNDRSFKILEAAIQEFINKGEPVSSKQIAEKYKFGVKDATIRSELNSLTESGFLNQPHTSGGRVPTDKGYQFLANKIMQDFFDSVDNLNHNFNKMINILENDRWTNVIDQVSENMKLLSAGYKNKGNETYKTGLNELFERLEVRSHDDFCQIAKDFEMLDERLEKLPKIFAESDSPKIFIGKKSPITESEHLSVIIDSYDVDGNRFYLAAIGPKRMDYEKNIKYFKKVKDSIKKSK
jgi:transcriptional regulator of heat shock response